MDFYKLTTEPIDINTVARRVVPAECGATVTLDGYARRFTKDKATGEVRETEHLVYEAYETMALKELQKLIEQAKAEFEISSVGIVHRLGRLEIGETSVVISVAAPHRRAAFAACEWLIKELKRTVPIWKKEVYADGETWSEGEPGASN
jgi:molybdopterin synthase catalytic subunit